MASGCRSSHASGFASGSGSSAGARSASTTKPVRPLPRSSGSTAHRGGTALLGGAALVTALTIGPCTPQVTLADGGDEPAWTSDDVDFEPPPAIPGRRLFVERVTVADTSVTVALKAAADINVDVRAFGGAGGKESVYWRAALLEVGERDTFTMHLDGPSPSVTFSWREGEGQAGAVSLIATDLPYPLPAVEGEVCDLRVASITWTPAQIEGELTLDCEDEHLLPTPVQVVSGHVDLRHTVLQLADVVSVAGTATVIAGETSVAVPLSPDGGARFELAVAKGRQFFEIGIEAELTASLSVHQPPLMALTHYPSRTESFTRTVSVTRPGVGRTVTDTVTVTQSDGATSTHAISAYLSIPAAVVQRSVVVEVEHPAHIRAEIINREPVGTSLSERFTLATSIAGDDSYQLLVVPESPVRTPVIQVPISDYELFNLLARLGWGVN